MALDNIPWKHILGDKLTKADGPPELHPLVEAALIYLEASGLNTQGLFRVPGSASQVKVLKESYKLKKKVPDLSETDAHTVCSLLTDHLRSEEPLLTYNLAPRWVQASGMPDLVVRLTKYVDLINQLPLANHITLVALLRLLVLISQHAEKTLMPASNLGTIFGPMICRRQNADIAQELGDIPAVSKLCIDLITHFSQLFDYYDLDGPAGGLADGGCVDSPRTKKVTRRKFQFGKDKPFQGDRSSDRSAPPVPSSPLAGSPAMPIQSPLVAAPDYEPPAAAAAAAGTTTTAEGDDDGDFHNGRTRKNALIRPEGFASGERTQGQASPTTPTRAGHSVSLSFEVEAEPEPEDSDDRPERARVDSKAVMRSLSSMGGFYAKGVSKSIAFGEDMPDLTTSTSTSTATTTTSSADVEEADDSETKDDKKKRLPALNLKKRKDSMDKKKLRMFSPRKLFDKSARASPDSTGELSSDSERAKLYYDGSSSSDRDDPSSTPSSLTGKSSELRFGGRTVPIRSHSRKSSSWPEAELAAMLRAEAAAGADDDTDESEEGGEATPEAVGASKLGSSASQSRVKSDTSSDSQIEAVRAAERSRKGSQSERGTSASARVAAARASKMAGAKEGSSTWTNVEAQIRKERDRDLLISPRNPGGGVNDGLSTAAIRTLWQAPSPRSGGMPSTDMLRSPRGSYSSTTNSSTTAMASSPSAVAGGDEFPLGSDVVVGHLGLGEELGLVRWKKRIVAVGTSGETRPSPELSQQAPTPGLATMLTRHYANRSSSSNGSGIGGSTSTSTSAVDGEGDGGDNGADEGPSKGRPRERPRGGDKDNKEAVASGPESEGDTDEEVDDEVSSTTEDDSISSSGEDRKTRQRRDNSGSSVDGEGKPATGRRRSGGRRNSVGKKAGKDGNNSTSTSSGLKLGRKVKRGEDPDATAAAGGGDQSPGPRPHSPRPRASEDHISTLSSGNSGHKSLQPTID